ncbi:hypothetical protein [Bacteriovorax sp. Seq25_V]|uniref:hypothetical protein n=1 Tax=Bacteriovorax sp. Seq25_V TaxID=1201288 RepID=UPI00038A3FE1|nr:hypothetical protein [Bacteriovorax sp. Seq25_V]EQC43731.1 hypothetical protein M900_1428 [Bacteriovorax sp. Seq25_V]
MKKLIMLLALLPFLTFGYSDPDAKTLMEEYQRFRTLVSTMKPDHLVGGWYKAKEYDGMTLMWNLGDEITDREVIRFFRKKYDGSIFAVTYHRSDYIVDGRIVLRRFVGPEPTGWVNHTIDYETGEELGSQGWWPTLDKSDEAFLNEWKIFH